jgi:hypothetical protein
MKKVLIWLVVIIAAAGLGLGAAAGVGIFIKNRAPNLFSSLFPSSGSTSLSPLLPFDRMPGGMPGFGPGMMGPGGRWDWRYNGGQSNGQRISIDQAADAARKAIANYGSNLVVSEVMEFSNNFYVAVKEADTGRGAFELLVQPYTGVVASEPGPNMMWNAKYGHMGGQGNNSLTMDQARQQAQKALDAQVPNAQVQPDGIAFYGYYTFDYQLNGQIAGMLSVNGTTGQAWLHTWHGTFIAEKEISK